MAPYVVTEARAYVVPITAEQAAGSQFDQQKLVAEGVMAMWWSCVHLGVGLPTFAVTRVRMPLHSSGYNLLGEYQV